MKHIFDHRRPCLEADNTITVQSWELKRGQNHDYMCFASKLLICYLKVITKAEKFDEIRVKFHFMLGRFFV